MTRIGTSTASAVALALCSAQMPAFAAEGGQDDSGVLQEVVVTARYRAESLQDVPVAVTAFSAQEIEDAGVRGYGGFIALSPNVSLVEAESVGQSFLTIRGLTQVRNSEAPVAFVVDGVQQTSNRLFSQALFDIESIQVLKGPQGALYGRNASGGAIVVTTKQPTNELAGHVQVGAAKGSEYSAQAVLSGPIKTDTLLFRVAGSYLKRDGYFDNVFLGREADGLEDKTFRGLLSFIGGENFSADVRLNYSRTDGRALNYIFQPTRFAAADSCFADPANPFGGPPSDPNRVRREFCANNLGLDTREIREAALRTEYRLDGATITAILAYNTLKEFTGGDQFPYSASRNLLDLFDGTQTQFFDIRSRSAELRISSANDQRLRWMVGAYGLQTDRFISTTTGRDLGLGILEVRRDPAFASAVNPTLSWFSDTNDNRSWALFANVAYDVTPQMEISAAVRYDNDDRRQSVDPRNTGGVPPGCTAASSGSCVRRASFDEFQPKVTASYEFAQNVRGYASWGRGFRSGEFNQFGTGVAAASVGLPGVSDLVPEERAESAELGLKSELLNRRLRVNLAAFDTKVEGQQYFVFVGAVGAQVLVAIDEVQVRGGELEVEASPFRGLDVYAGLGISDSEVRRYALNPASVGNWAPYVPKVSYNAGVQYRVPVSPRLRLMTRLDFISKGKQYWDPENSAPRDTVSLLNARVGIESGDDSWSLVGGVENLTDEEYNAEYVLGGFAQPAPPRVWSVQLRYTF